MNRIATTALRGLVLPLLLVVAGWTPMALAATIIVTSTADNLTGGDGLCTLREAIRNANSNSDTTSGDCAAGTGTDTIVLQAGQTYTLSIPGTGEDAALTGDLDITDAAGLTISTDATGSTATIDANDIDRVLEKTVGALTLIDLIIEDGRATEPGFVKQGGGGLRSLDGDVTLTRTTVRDNETFITTGEVGGGGIALPYSSSLGTGGSGTLTLDESTLDGNRSLDDHGGGLYASGSGLTVVITNSTISGNTAAEDFSGGGILFADGVTATILNSTIAGNGFSGNGDGFGGGIGFFDGNETLTIRFSTIAGNDAGSENGGGIDNDFGASVTMSTTILADNTAGTSGPDCLGTITSTVGHNVVEDLTDCTLSGTTTGNVTGLDPGLGMLADNGGLTLTKSITGTSVAFNTIASGTDGCGTSITTDQRASGFTRPQGATCDIGAFEANVATSTLTVTGSGTSNGIVTGFGVTCTSTAGAESDDCSQIYANGTSVTMTATASTGSFVGFTGTGSASACSTSPCTFPISATSTLDAAFSLASPDLEVVKSNDGTPILLGDTWEWRLVTSNNDTGDAVFTTGQTILSDQLPTSNVSYGSVTVDSQTGITGTISCSISGGGLLTCTASGGSVTIAGSTGTFRARFTATPADTGTFTNPTGGTCSVDPSNNITESDETNNDCNRDAVVVTAPDLEVVKSNDGTPILLGNAWEWRLVTSNNDTGDATFASGETILSDQLPTTDVSYGSVTVDNQTAITGTISCSINGSGLLTCTASGGTVIIGGSTGTFRARFTATPADTGTFTNPTSGTCSVDPNNDITESDETNNTCGPNAVVVTAPDLEVTKTNTVGGTVVLPNTWDWRMDVANTGDGAATFASGETIFEDTMPATGVSYAGAAVSNQTGISGTGSISCNLVTNVITCTASGGTVILAATTGTFRVTTTATPSTTGDKINPTGGICEVDPGENVTESDESNNTCSDTVTVTGVGSITIVKDANTTDGTDFPFTSDIPGGSTFTLDDDTDPTLSDTESFSSVPADSYDVTETVPAGWTLVSIVCTGDTDGGNSIDLANDMVTIDLDNGEDITCTFTNAETNLVINEVDYDQPGGDDAEFIEILNNGTVSVDLSLVELELVNGDAGGATSYDTISLSGTLAAGDYYVVCGDAANVANCDLDTTPNTGLIQNGGAGTANPDAVVLRRAASAAILDVVSYEGCVPGFSEGGGTCAPADPASSSPTDDDKGISRFADGTDTDSNEDDFLVKCISPGAANIAASSSCTTGTIVIVKDADPADGTDFSFSTSGGLSPSTFTLDDAVPDDADSFTDTQTFASIAVGSYSVTETVLTGWSLDSATCTGGDFTAITDGVSITLDPGETITCTFTNTKLGTITIVKDTDPDDPQDFSYTDDIEAPNAFTLDDDGDPTYTNTKTFTDVSPGTYTVTEGAVTGYDLTALTCVDSDTGGTTSTGDTGSGEATINLDPGETVTCTYTNTERGTIEIVKATDPAGGTGFSFTDDIEAPNSFSLDDADTKTFSDVMPGTYTVTEDDPTPGFDLTALTCVDSDTGGTTSTGSVGTRAATINLDPGETVTCTYTNTERGTIEIVKATDPAGGTGFSFTDDIEAPNSFSLDDADTKTFSDVMPGTYTVTEDDPTPGFDLTGLTCVDSDTGGTTSTGSVVTRAATINLDPGETVTCTYTNTERGTINIIKDTVPDDAQDFSYIDDIEAPNAFTLDDDGDPTFTNTQTFTNVVPGSYSVTEGAVAGYDATVSCVDPDGGSTTAGTNVATIDLDPGETITCTFTNDGRGTITIIKAATPEDDTGFDFTETITPGAFTLTDPTDNTEVFTDVDPGTYSVTETVPTGWTLEDASCTGGDFTAITDGVEITLDAGEDIICTFTNQGRGSITIVKDAIPEDDTPFDYTSDIPGGTAFTLMDPSDNTEAFTGVAAGSYDVTETLPTGWELSMIICTGDTDGGSTVDQPNGTVTIDLDPGEDITCTFTNDGRGMITIIKDAAPEDDTPFDFAETITAGTFTLTDPTDNTEVFTDVDPGSYDVTETLPANWTLEDIVCTGDTDGGSVVDLGTETVTIDLDPGEDITCTFTNQGRGTINIVKEALPEDDTAFDFTGDLGAFTLTDPSDDTETFADIATGSYDVTETLPASWTLEDIVCTGDTDGGSVVDLGTETVTIDLDPGEDITCTFSNQGRGTINIVKEALPEDDTAFDFTGDLGAFTLMDPSDDTETFAAVAAGVYEVIETVPADWTLESIVCTGDTDTGTEVDLGAGSVAIDLDPGEDITCTFTNQGRGSITIVKDAIPADDTVFDFTETITPGTFTLQDPSDDTETFTAVAAGSYDVTETVPTGWALSMIICTGDTDGGSVVDQPNGTVAIDLDPGEDITCTFTNDGRGMITIVKDAAPEDDTPFDFAETITAGTFTLTDPSDNTEVFTGVTPGSYEVTETLPANWTLESIVCTGDDDGGSVVDLANNKVTIDHDAGEQITCTFTNQGRGTINIVKAATPEDDTAFDFTETITPGAFTLMDPSDDTETFADIAAGSYDVTETLPANWTLDSIVCTGDLDAGSTVASPTVTIDLDPGETITCTFTNDGPPIYNATKTDALFADNDSDGEVSPGDVLEYTIAINNTGGVGTNTVFTDTPDANTTLVAGSVTTSQGTITTGNGGGDTMVEVALGDVAPGSPAATITFRVTINDPFPAGVTTVSNQGALTADDDPNAPVLTDDPDTTPAGDDTDTPIGGASTLSATKADVLQVDIDNDGQADSGDTIRYTVVLTNNGNVGAPNVVFTDTPGVNTTLVVGSVTNTDGTVDSGNGGGDTDVQVSIPMIAGGGGSVTITFDVTVDTPFPSSERQVANQGLFTADGDPGGVTDDPDTALSDDPTATPIDVTADLSLTKTASSLTPDFGSEVTFELIIRNAGPSDAGATVTDVLPAGLTYVSHSGGDYDPRTGAWQTGRLAVGVMDSLWITARVETVFPVTNAAEVTRASLRDPDSTPDDGQGDDYDAVTITPVAADLEIEKKVIAFDSDPNGPGFGDDTVTATFKITVTNHGPSVATGIFVDDPVPAGATLDSAVPTQGFYDVLTEIWTVGELTVGASASLVVTMTGGGGNNLFNLAEVFADQPDQNPENNLDGAAGQHNRDDPELFTADLSLTKTVDNETPRVGDLITYTIRLLNSGPATTDGVVVGDDLPDGLEFVSAATTTAGGYNDSLGTWIVGHLPRDSTVVLTVTARVTGTGTIVNLAQVLESHLPDPDSRFGDGDERDDDTDTATIVASTNKATAAVREGVGGAEGTPRRTELGKNYPNPFNPQTVIPFGLPEAEHVTVEVYNLIGQRVARLLDQPMAAGRHEVIWNATNQPSGLYLVRLSAGAVVKVQRVTLVK